MARFTLQKQQLARARATRHSEVKDQSEGTHTVITATPVSCGTARGLAASPDHTRICTHYLRQVPFSSARRKDRELTLSLDDDSTAASEHARRHSSRYPSRSTERTFLGRRRLLGDSVVEGHHASCATPTTGSCPTRR